MKSFRLDRSRFDSQTEKLRKAMEEKQQEVMREMERKLIVVSAGVAQDLAEQSFPLPPMIGPAIAAIRADIGRVFITAGKAYEILRGVSGTPAAAAFYAAYEKGDFHRARNVLQASGGPIRSIRIGTVQPELHQQARSAETGRVTLTAPLLIVPKDQLESYIADCIKGIGKTASGWNACAMKLGAGESGGRFKSTAVHGSEGGTVSFRRDAGQLKVVIENVRPLARKHLSASQVAAVVASGREQLLRLMAE